LEGVVFVFGGGGVESDGGDGVGTTTAMGKWGGKVERPSS
jgi:hypothetical protein